MTLLELFDNESKWIQGNLATDKDGQFCSPNSTEAVKWCLIGGIYKCYTTSNPAIFGSMKYREVYDKLSDVSYHFFGEEWLTRWNDNPDRKF